MEWLPKEAQVCKQQVLHLGFILCLRENTQRQAQEHPRQTQLRGSGERQGSVELGSRTQALKGHDLELLTCMKEHLTACETVKTRLVLAPALELADLNLSHCMSRRDKARVSDVNSSSREQLSTFALFSTKTDFSGWAPSL